MPDLVNGRSLVTGDPIQVWFPDRLAGDRHHAGEILMPDVIIDARAPGADPIDAAPATPATPTSWWDWVLYYLGLWP